MDSVKDIGKQTDYLSYLLRLWRDTDEPALWRASLQSPYTSERIHFASLEDLCDHLRRQTTASTKEGTGLTNMRKEEEEEMKT